MLFTILLCSVKYLSLTLPSQPLEIKHTVPCGVIFGICMYRECMCARRFFGLSIKTVYNYDTTRTVFSKIHRQSFS